MLSKKLKNIYLVWIKLFIIYLVSLYKNNYIEMKKNNPFTVPSDYFETFNKDILLQIKSVETSVGTKRKSLYNYLKWIGGCAAIIVLILGYRFAIVDNTTNSVTNSILCVSEDNESSRDTKVASMQNDYYLFIEDEAMQHMYKDYITSANF